MKNFIQPGRVVTVTAPADVSSGDLVVVGTLFGVAATDAKSGDAVEIVTEGVFTLPKTNAQAWIQGVKVYFDSENEVLTTTASTNLLIGHAVSVAANPSAAGAVRLSI